MESNSAAEIIISVDTSYTDLPSGLRVRPEELCTSIAFIELKENTMSLKLNAATFEDASLAVRGTCTEDRTVFSLLFDNLVAQSQTDDNDAAPATQRAEGVVRCEGSGWVSVLVRGAVAVAGEHGYAHAFGWVNGRRIRATPREPDEPFSAAVAAPVGADGQLRISLLLLAQRDLASSSSAALCAVDSIDISVLPARQTRGKA